MPNSPPTWEETQAVPSWEDTTEPPKWEDTTDVGQIPQLKAPGSVPLAEQLRNYQTESDTPVKMLGRGFERAGRAAKNIAGAYAFEAAGDPESQAKQLGVGDTTLSRLGMLTEPSEEGVTPLEQGERALPTVGKVLSKGAYGLVESSPRIAGVAGLSAMGVPAPLAAGAVFGTTSEGFSPKDAAVAAALPYVGRYSGEIVGAIARKFNVPSATALNVWKSAGAMTGAAGYLATIQESEIQNLPPEQRKQARIDMVANLMGQSVLGPMGVERENLVNPAVDQAAIKNLSIREQPAQLANPPQHIVSIADALNEAFRKAGMPLQTKPIDENLQSPQTGQAIPALQPEDNNTQGVAAVHGDAQETPVANQGDEKVLNPGGAESALPAELQAQSKANNSREAFEALAKQARSPLPSSETTSEATGADPLGEQPPVVEKVQQAPIPERFDTLDDILKFKQQRINEEKQLYQDKIGLTPDEASRLQSIISRDGSTVKFEKSLTPEKVAKLNWFFEESPYNLKDNPNSFEFWEHDKNYNPEELNGEDDKSYIATSLINAVQKGVEANPQSDRFIYAAYAARKFQELGATKSDLARALDGYTTRNSGSQGDKAFLFKDAGKKLNDFMASQGIDLTQGDLGAKLSDVKSQPKQLVDQTVNNQRYRIGNNPTTYAVIERLPQSEAEKANGEQAVTVKNERTGDIVTVSEADLRPVNTRTEPRPVKAPLDNQLREVGLDPSVFKSRTEKQAALKRQRAISEGPGAASPGDVPAAPPVTTPSDITDNPHEVISPTAGKFQNFRQDVANFIKGAAGESMPKTTSANRELGEAGVRYASSKIAARPLAATFAAHTLQDTGVNPSKFGAALVEDNLRSVRENFRQQATQLLADGKESESEAATAQADRVTSLIGAEKSPFKTEDEYQDFLNEPPTKKALAQHVQQWNEIIEPQYRQARDIDPDVELPSRGLQTGARINLKAVFPEDNPVTVVRSSPSLTATFKRNSPFARKAKGTGTSYEVNYPELIANTFERQLEIANKNAFDRKLVETGNAVIDRPGKTVMIGGEQGVAFPLTRRSIVTDEGTFPQTQNIYVKRSLAEEYRTASNMDIKHRFPIVTPTANVLNKVALAGLTDFSVHTSNLMTALFNRPTSGKLLVDALLSATGRADIPVTLLKALLKSFKDNSDQLSKISEIGAGRGEYMQTGLLSWSGKALKALDKTTRLVLDDTFTGLAKEGLVEDTETNRREYINQVGQYNRRLQGPLMKWLRDTGFGPFATAGRTFNALGVKMVTMSPGVRASNNFAAMALRANVLSKWVGATVLLASLNYMLTKDKGGGVLGRPGTPLGKIDTGKDDKNGRPLSMPFLDIIGLGRGLRITGIRGAVDAKRNGLTDGSAIDAAARDIANSALGPAMGPVARAGTIAYTGYPTAVNVGRASPVARPGESQFKENAIEALKEVNPMVKGAFDYKAGKPLGEVLANQIPRFTMSPGKSSEMIANYPKIVGSAQTHAYADDIASRARKMELSQRAKFVNDSLEGLTQEQRAMVVRTLKMKHVSY